jgi:ABC-type nitrate/sulfonate/bicarbonate transport system substrate-binding protein
VAVAGPVPPTVRILTSLYSSLHANAKSLKERPVVTQKFVAALAESILFVEKNPEKGRHR